MFFTKKNNRIPNTGSTPLVIRRQRRLPFRFQRNGALTGFTLIELMVVLVIMMALAILVIAGYFEGRPRFVVERTAEGFIGDLYRIRQKSGSSVFYEKDNGEKIISGGYGILIEENVDDKYIIFVDDEGILEVVETINLETSAKIESGEAKIFFSSDREVFFNDAPATEEISVIFSARSDDSIKRTVSINSEGVAKVIYE